MEQGPEYAWARPVMMTLATLAMVVTLAHRMPALAADGPILVAGLEWGMARQDVVQRTGAAPFHHPWAEGDAVGLPSYPLLGEVFALDFAFQPDANGTERLQSVHLFKRGGCFADAYDRLRAELDGRYAPLEEPGAAADLEPGDRNLVLAAEGARVSLILMCGDPQASFRMLMAYETQWPAEGTASLALAPD